MATDRELEQENARLEQELGCKSDKLRLAVEVIRKLQEQVNALHENAAGE